jgi:FKBP-type peptidyl-prolyl cis-trans isomerase
MKNQLLRFTMIAIAFMVLGTFTSCKHMGYKKDDSGFYYKFYVENEDSTQVQMGDLVEITHTLRALDSTFIDNQPMQLLVRESLFEGDLYAALLKMHQGDSATFIMNIDTFFHYFFGIDDYNPEQKDRDIYLDIKINKIIPAAEFKAQQEEQEAKYKAEMEKLRLAEDSTLKKYIADNNIKVTPTASGLYYIQKVAGKGKAAENNKNVTVHYTGKLLDGTIFDSSVDKDPIVIPLGQGRVIQGWEEGIAMMKEGGKAQLIIPSALGYGEYGAGGVIPPYATLIFDVELVKVEDLVEPANTPIPVE